MEYHAPAVVTPASAGYQVEDLIIDLGQERVLRGAIDIPLPHLSFELLLALVRAAPDLVTFDQLSERVWAGLVITPETISQRVKLVRDALGDDPHAPRYIAGVRGRGYRMVASVRPLADRRRAATVLQAGRPQAGAPAAEARARAAPATSTATAPPGTPGGGRRRFAWLGGAAVIALLLAIPWALTRYLRPARTAAVPVTAALALLQPPHTIAVLPLVDMSPSGGNAYLGDGLAQELSARLARIRGLRVAARTSAFAFKERSADVRTIAQTLGVRHVLEGSVRREGDHLRVTAQLIDAASGFNVWSQTYDRTWQDLLPIEDDLARSIIGALQVVLSSELAQRVEQPPTTQLAAFDLYLAGLAKLHGPAGAAQLAEADDIFRQALAHDPRFALAYAGLCQRYSIGYDQSRDPALVSQAELACSQALKLDDSLREVSAALGHLYLVSGRHAQAQTIFRDAIHGDPGDADGYIGLGEACDGQQRGADAEHAFREAIEVEPTYWAAHTALGNFLFRHGRYGAAVTTYRRVTELIPASPLAFNNLGAALEMNGDFAGAAPAFERSLALEPTRSAYSNSGTVYYFLGRYGDAARMFSRATEIAAEDHRVWGNLADALWQIEASRPQAQDAYRRAITLAQRSLEVNAQDPLTWIQLGYYSARVGDADHAARYASRALSLGKQDLMVHYYAALIALERRDAAAALDSLDRAVTLGYPAQLVRAAPDFASLRSDARFRQMLAQTDKTPAG
jgi:TolB-like protein/Flp pilus assembly protein TadD/DNA-binding winged helix-turn-helix (wHTH) protein